MLALFTRKLCPLMSLTVATIGCGKKIVESDATIAPQIENQVPPSTFVIQLNGSETTKKEFLAPRDANFYLPEKLKVTAGIPANHSVEIFYKVDPYDSDYYRFKCVYTGTSNVSEMNLHKCMDLDNREFSSVDLDETFDLYKNEIILMKIQGSNAKNLSVEAFFQWIK